MTQKNKILIYNKFIDNLHILLVIGLNGWDGNLCKFLLAKWDSIRIFSVGRTNCNAIPVPGSILLRQSFRIQNTDV